MFYENIRKKIAHKRLKSSPPAPELMSLTVFFDSANNLTASLLRNFTVP